MSNKKTKLYLGLDLGITSIGWSVSKDTLENKQIKTEIDDMGVVLWDPPFETVKQKNITHNEERRKYRGKRRSANREKNRKHKTFEVLKEISNSSNDKITFNSLVEGVDKLRTKNKGQEDKISPYKLKVKGLTQKLSYEEFCAVLLHYCNYRGYSNKFEVDNTSTINIEKNKDDETEQTKPKKISAAEKKEKEDKKQWAEGINLARKLKEENRNLTCTQIALNNLNEKGEFLIRNRTRKGAKKTIRYVFQRDDLEKEMRMIVQRQLELRNIKSSKLIKEMEKSIFHQNTFEGGPGKGHNPEEKIEYRKNRASEIRKELETIKRNNPVIKQTGVNSKQMRNDELRDYVKQLQAELYAVTHFISPREMKEFCPFLTNKRRGYKSSITFDLFQMVNEVSKLKSPKLKTTNEEWEEFSKKMYDTFYEKEGLVTKTDVKTVFMSVYGKDNDPSKKTNVLYPAYNNISIKSDFSKLLKDFRDKGQKWAKYPTPTTVLDFDKKIGSIFNYYSTPIVLQKKLSDVIGDDYTLTMESLMKTLSNKSLSTANTSMKWMTEANRAFLGGVNYGVFQEKISEKIFSDTKKIEIPKNKNDLFNIKKNPQIQTIRRNSTVYSAISKVASLMSKLDNRYGDFEKIIIEVSNGFKLTGEEKNKHKENQANNRKSNKKVDEFIEQNNLRWSPSLQRNVFLWFQQDKKCLISGKTITIDDLKHNVECDHIFPKSQLEIDNRDNRMLVTSTVNQEKSNMTPIEYLNSPKGKKYSIVDYKNRVNIMMTKKDGFKPSYLKQNILLSKDMNDPKLKDFKDQRQAPLNDTRYIVKVLKEWLKKELVKKTFIEKGTEQPENEQIIKELNKNKSKVLEVNGITTSTLRKLYLKNSPWGQTQKVRDLSPWHHGIDASIISTMRNHTDKEFYETYSNALRVAKSKLWDLQYVNKSEDRTKVKESFERALKSYKKTLENTNIKANVSQKRIEWFNDQLDNLLKSFNDSFNSRKHTLNIDDDKLTIGDNDFDLKSYVDSVIPVNLKMKKINKTAHDSISFLLPNKSIDRDNKKPRAEYWEKKIKALDNSTDFRKNKTYLEIKKMLLSKTYLKEIISNIKPILSTKPGLKGDELNNIVATIYIGLKRLKTTNNKDKDFKNKELFIDSYFGLFWDVLNTLHSEFKKNDKIVRNLFVFLEKFKNNFQEDLVFNLKSSKFKNQGFEVLTTVDGVDFGFGENSKKLIKYYQNGKIGNKLTQKENIVPTKEMNEYYKKYISKNPKVTKSQFFKNEHNLQKNGWLWKEKNVLIDKHNNAWLFNQYHGFKYDYDKQRKDFELGKKLTNLEMKDLKNSQIKMLKKGNVYKVEIDGKVMFLNYNGVVSGPTFTLNGLQSTSVPFDCNLENPYPMARGKIKHGKIEKIEVKPINIFGEIQHSNRGRNLRKVKVKNKVKSFSR